VDTAHVSNATRDPGTTTAPSCGTPDRMRVELVVETDRLPFVPPVREQ
jgi:hypothetical protein